MKHNEKRLRICPALEKSDSKAAVKIIEQLTLHAIKKNHTLNYLFNKWEGELNRINDIKDINLRLRVIKLLEQSYLEQVEKSFSREKKFIKRAIRLFVYEMCKSKRRALGCKLGRKC